MSECKNDGILSLVTNFARSLENKLDITVTEFIFHCVCNFCAYLKKKIYLNMVVLLPSPA